MEKKIDGRLSEGGVPTDILDEAKHAAGNVITTATAQIERRLDSEKNKAIEAIGGAADAIRRSAENNSASSPAGALGVRAANSIDDVADYLESRTLRDVVGELEGFARREPALFLGGAFVLGLVGGRFLKSSARSRKDARRALAGGAVDQPRTRMTRGGQHGPAQPIVAARAGETVRESPDLNEVRDAYATRGAPSVARRDALRSATERTPSAPPPATPRTAPVAPSAAASPASSSCKTTDGAPGAQASESGSPNLPPDAGVDARKVTPSSPLANVGDKTRVDGVNHTPRVGGESRT